MADSCVPRYVINTRGLLNDIIKHRLWFSWCITNYERLRIIPGQYLFVANKSSRFVDCLDRKHNVNVADNFNLIMRTVTVWKILASIAKLVKLSEIFNS